MTKILTFIFFILVLNNCTINKVVKHHGVHFLEKKQTKLKISETNKNDTKIFLGPPLTTNSFINDIWIYMERKTTVSELRTLGRKKLLVNNVLVLEFDNRGLLVKKDFYNKNQMNNLKISKSETEVLSKKQTFISSVLTSLKHKINDPLGKRTAR
jgi:outer membrane protein assembly factor BamE (lipoprotein component of BamABCDE complex)